MNTIKHVPYDNGKVKIGIYYQPPKYIEQDSDMLRLQSYLIHDPARLKQEYWTNLVLKFSMVFVLFLMMWRFK